MTEMTSRYVVAIGVVGSLVFLIRTTGNDTHTRTHTPAERPATFHYYLLERFYHAFYSIALIEFGDEWSFSLSLLPISGYSC